MIPYHPNLFICQCGQFKEIGSSWCPTCHAAEVEKAHAGEREPIGCEAEEIRVERNLGPPGGSLPFDLAVKFQRGRARNGRVLRLNKSLQ